MNTLEQSFKELLYGLQNFDLNIYSVMKYFREYFMFFEKKGCFEHSIS